LANSLENVCPAKTPIYCDTHPDGTVFDAGEYLKLKGLGKKGRRRPNR
jgi:hypothetical protein